MDLRVYAESMEMEALLVDVRFLGGANQLKRKLADETNTKRSREILDRKQDVLEVRGIADMRQTADNYDNKSNTTMGVADMGTMFYRWRGLLCERPNQRLE